MVLDKKFAPIHKIFYKFVDSSFVGTATLFGYPKNPGLPIRQELTDQASLKEQFLDKLPVHAPGWPLPQRPETWFEMIFGPIPKPDIVTRYIYESKDEGFYNFYIKNYKDIYFLPDWLSEFIQIKLKICLDHSMLEAVREGGMVILFVFSLLINLRLALAWFMTINPFSLPWRYVVALVDWSEELFQGAIPFILGINIFASFFLVIIGAMADDLNNLIFTMPFLPSEGEKIKLLVNKKMENVIVFHYLPLLWYKYKIPNEIREFWYQERPDILKYMQKTYNEFHIQVLPNNILTQVNHSKASSVNISYLNSNKFLTDILLTIFN